jgi:hypothetical protein
MQHIPLLFVCVTIGGSTIGCASSMDELMTEARECVDTSTNEFGVIGASDEQRAVCWADVNKRIEASEQREKRQEQKRGASCGPGLVAWCDWKGCVCISQSQVREIFRRAGY